MAIYSINRCPSSLIRPQNSKLIRSLALTTSSSADIYWAHLQKNGTNLERTLFRVKSKLDTTCVKEILHKCAPNQPLLGLRFFIWAGNQSNYRHSSYIYSKACELFDITRNPHVVSDVIEAYRIEGCLITAKMFRVVLNLCRQANLADEGLWVLKKMEESNCRPDTTAYNVVIRLFCEKGNMDVASDLMREMSLVNLYPDMITYIAMIKGFCNVGRLEDACVLFRVMKEHGCVPNAVVYSALLHGVRRYGSLERALDLLAEMERESGDCSPNVVTYTTVIQGFCERRKTMEALCILDRMHANGCAPNRVTVNVLIKGLCSEGLTEEAYKLIDKVVSEGSVSGSECCSSLVISLLRIQNFEEAEKLFRRMLVSEVKPDGLASSTMIKVLCLEGRVLDAFYLYSEIDKMGYLISIDSDIYSILLDGLCKENHLAEVMEHARLIAERNIQLKAPYVDGIVQYLKKSGDEELVSNITNTQK